MYQSIGIGNATLMTWMRQFFSNAFERYIICKYTERLFCGSPKDKGLCRGSLTKLNPEHAPTMIARGFNAPVACLNGPPPGTIRCTRFLTGMPSEYVIADASVTQRIPFLLHKMCSRSIKVSQAYFEELLLRDAYRDCLYVNTQVPCKDVSRHS